MSRQPPSIQTLDLRRSVCITVREDLTARTFHRYLGTTFICTSMQQEVVVVIRAKLWFRCAAMHDPVTPNIVQPALIGWEAKKRRVDLTIDRAFNGEELVRRMKGWVTVDPAKAIEVVNRFGRLKVLDDRELVVEVEKKEDLQGLEKALAETFGNEVNVEEIVKSSSRNV